MLGKTVFSYWHSELQMIKSKITRKYTWCFPEIFGINEWGLGN